eukprot:5757183-Alexandrium_andersonii.AAC.1
MGEWHTTEMDEDISLAIPFGQGLQRAQPVDVCDHGLGLIDADNGGWSVVQQKALNSRVHAMK